MVRLKNILGKRILAPCSGLHHSWNCRSS